MATSMNPVIRAQLDQFKQANPVEGYSDSDYFECFSAYSVLNGHLTENIDPFDVHLRGAEFGLDGACLLVQGQPALNADDASALTTQFKDGVVDFIFLQAKSGDKFEYGEISKFLDSVYGFFQGSMSSESDQLDDLIAAKEVIYGRPLRSNPKLSCFFVTTGTYQKADRIEKLLDAQKTRLGDLNLFNSVEASLIGARDEARSMGQKISRERARDALRSEAFSKEFREILDKRIKAG